MGKKPAAKRPKEFVITSPTANQQEPTTDDRARRPRHTIVMMSACVVLAAALTSCGEGGREQPPPLSAGEENDVPLNPPTLRFHVSSDGQVGSSPDLEAEAGEVVALVLENEDDVAHELRLVDPDGTQVFAVEAPAAGRGDGRAQPRNVGEHVASVHPADDPGAGTTFTVTVTES